MHVCIFAISVQKKAELTDMEESVRMGIATLQAKSEWHYMATLCTSLGAELPLT